MKNFLTTLLLVVFFAAFLAPVSAQAESLGERLKGKILIQTEGSGEAWYVNPANGHRYYLGLPVDAFNIMSRLGLGISNQDFDGLDSTRLEKLAGKILIKVEDDGQAYYVNPDSLELSFLGRPLDAFNVMKGAGLGISDADLDKIQESALNLSGFDFQINPGDDFYSYVNANWIKKNPIPSDKSRWDSFTILAEENLYKLKGILEKDYEEGTEEHELATKVQTFYNTGMDMEEIETESLEIIKEEMAMIDEINNLDDLAEVLAHMHIVSSQALFDFYSYPDMENSEMNIAEFWQNGTNLPDKPYYFDNDEKSVEIRDKYVEFIAEIFSLSGEENAEEKAQIVMDIETKLASTSLAREETRDPKAINHKMNLEEFKSLSPNFNWDLYLEEIGIDGDPGIINASMPVYIEGINKLLTEIPLEDWKLYLKWDLLDSNLSYMSKDFYDANFDFYYRYLNGYDEQEERWKTVLKKCDSSLGMLLGKIYVKENFSPAAKEKMIEMIDNIRETYRERITSLDWMSEETKESALVKLDAINTKIGYPDVWPDQSMLEIKDDSYLANIFRIREFKHNKSIDEIGKEVDQNEWHMNPQTVNAYYSPPENEIVFPAGILQAPFFDEDADDAMNYGGIGMVISHEITHGFDDQGRKYDEQGNLRDWWTEADAQNFDDKAEALVEQFNNYSPLPGINVNGELTEGENIADLGGLTISYHAFQKTDEAKAAKKIDGFSPEQRFFLSLAQIWRQNIKDERLEYLVKNDYHSPAKYRVNGPISNFSPFSEAFELSAEAPMMRPLEKRTLIW